MKYIVISVLSVTTIFSACKHKDSIANDHTTPAITVVEPVSSDTSSLSAEPEIHIEFTATDNVGLSSLTVQLLDASNTILYSASPTVSNLLVYPFHQHFVPGGIITVTPMRVKILATDLAGNSENKVIDFFVAP